MRQEATGVISDIITVLASGVVSTLVPEQLLGEFFG
jgi:hypothetical protein